MKTSYDFDESEDLDVLSDPNDEMDRQMELAIRRDNEFDRSYGVGANR